MSLQRFAELAQKLKSEYVDIELEARLKIPPLIEFKSAKKRTITYYRSLMYPSIIFRSSIDYHIQSKELIEKRKINGILVSLSVEQTYIKSDIKIALIEIGKRIIYRKTIQENPKVEIIRHNNEYMLEIEFDKFNYHKVFDIINMYKCNYYPIPKPMEISSINLARKLSYIQEWGISEKADGTHVTVLENKKQRVLLFDNGEIMSINNKVKRKMIEPLNVYEAELMENNKLLYFDCLMYNKKDITSLDYKERRSYIEKPKIKKDVFIFSDINQLKTYINKKPSIKSDGYVITNIKNRNQVFKSKFKNTVDLKYKNGYLLLENEEISNRIPNTNINFEFENNKIYEFDLEMSLIRERNDKIIANYKFPYDDNPIYKIVNGIGVPSIRCFHNKIKFELLKMIPKLRLLDIGSGKGGDINKWINLGFKQVYAIDPNIDFRIHHKNVVEINKEAKRVPDFIKYDCISILFVPWNDDFIEIIDRCSYGILILMSNAFEYECELFKCEIDGDKINLKIPYTETAENINEIKCDDELIILKLKERNWNISKLNFHMNFGTIHEQKLSSMYNYFYIYK